MSEFQDGDLPSLQNSGSRSFRPSPMTLLSSIEELSALPGPVALAIGVFDGVHLGHQEVIRGALGFSEKHGGTAVVVTFDPHPLQVVRPGAAPRMLCSTRHKLRLLERMAAECALVIPFDEALSRMPAEEFVQSLVRACRPLGLVSVGYGWSFGRDRAGNIHRLMDLGEALGFAVYGVPEVRVDGETVSSTRIREAVRAGDFAGAGRLLGREYAILGKVVRGRELGRRLGFPTANLAVESEELPPNGVYAVRVAGVPGSSDPAGPGRPGVANLGWRPTVEAAATGPVLEVHLLDPPGDLYDRDLEVVFVRRLREERKFPGIEELKAQIARDIVEARAVL